MTLSAASGGVTAAESYTGGAPSSSTLSSVVRRASSRPICVISLIELVAVLRRRDLVESACLEEEPGWTVAVQSAVRQGTGALPLSMSIGSSSIPSVH